MEYEELIALLNEKGFTAEFVNNSQEALEAAEKLTSDCQTVGMGGSMTLFELNIDEMLLKRGKTIYSFWLEAKKDKPDPDVFKKAMFSDCFLTSANALTKEGDLVNIDGRGNRVAAMIYGPKKVGVFCGVNKITDNAMTAVERIKTIACPKNAARLGLGTPCALTGECSDCKSPQRMCRVITRIQYPPRGADIHIILINEELGY